MKHIYKLILLSAVFLGVILISCDDLLETKNFTDMSPSNFFKTEGDMDAAVTGIYLPCTTNWGYSDGGTGKWYNALFNADINAYYPAGMVATDETRHYLSNIFDEFTFGPSSGGALESTYNVIRFIARATDVINQIEQSSGATENIRNRYIAETKTLRAFYMYTLLDWFGPVNVKLNPESLYSNTIEPRPSLTDYISYIENDLKDAIEEETFPEKYNDDASNWGRMSKSIAYSIRMKLYMHQKDWERVKDDATKLMQMGFSLENHYEDVFNNVQSAEHIWAIPSSTASDNYYVTEVLPSDFKKGFTHLGRPYIRGNDANFYAGWQVFCMRWEFYDTFQENDVRKNTILSEYETSNGTHKDRTSGMVGAIPIKYMDTQYADWGIQKAHHVIRYAEILLSYAEAENEINGPNSAAISALQQVTDRAGIEIPATAISGKEAFRNYILEERGRELFSEGQRRQDLIRHGVFIQRAQERGNDAKNHHKLFPIPQAVITESNGIIQQNEGYTN